MIDPTVNEKKQSCPDCGSVLPDDSAHSLCPSCLIRQGLRSTLAYPDSAVNPAPPPPSPDEIADTFPGYEIIESLGRGGMGVVYKARQKSLDRLVAIKILAPDRIGNEQFAGRFSREAKMLARLAHPNIVTVYDYGETDGIYFIVMEYIDGVNLRDLLSEGKLDSTQALAIVPPICEALQFAHDKGIVHRDIKPENLLLDCEGRLKIADFGIASLVGTSGDPAGTPPYMAPEQSAIHTEVDHRADIYALGAVLYEMLTGERPGDALDPPSQQVEIDVRIDDIVLRALNREPGRRYRTAEEFRTQIENVTGTTAGQSPTAPTAANDQAAQTKPNQPKSTMMSYTNTIIVSTVIFTVIGLITALGVTSVMDETDRKYTETASMIFVALPAGGLCLGVIVGCVSAYIGNRLNHSRTQSSTKAIETMN